MSEDRPMSTAASHLVIKDLVVAPAADPSKHILNGINLTVKPGEVHAVSYTHLTLPTILRV